MTPEESKRLERVEKECLCEGFENTLFDPFVKDILAICASLRAKDKRIEELQSHAERLAEAVKKYLFESDRGIKFILKKSLKQALAEWEEWKKE